jgi:hypothetical protein
MTIASRRLSPRFSLHRFKTCGAVLSALLCASLAHAQSATTPLGRELEKIDLGVSGIGSFTPNSSGTSYLPQTIQQVPSNTLGALVELRYTHSPLIGVQFNYSYARFTENFTLSNTSTTPASQLPFTLGVQAKVDEFSLGYVAHGPTFFGLHTFAGVGGGGIEFKPTSGGGLDLPAQIRGAIYYQVGVDAELNEHFGLRGQFRQVFYGAPDFNQNYLATGARVSTTEPGVGFYLRF